MIDNDRCVVSQGKFRLVRTAGAVAESGPSNSRGLKTAEALPDNIVEVVYTFGHCDYYSSTMNSCDHEVLDEFLSCALLLSHHNFRTSLVE